MRIAQIGFNLECGGIQNMLANLSLGLAELGHHVDVFCLDRATGSACEQQWLETLSRSGVNVRFLGRKRHRVGIRALARLRRIARAGRYDVLHSHWPLLDALVGAFRSRGKNASTHVVTVHSTVQSRSPIMRFCATGSHVAYCSRAARRQSSFPSASATVIPNAIREPQSRAGRGAVRESIGLDAKTPVVISVGRLSPEKNFPRALEAVAELRARIPHRGLRFLIAGDGSEFEPLRSAAQTLGLEDTVTFLGARTDVADMLDASDVFLSTSTYEGMPLAVLEALHAGLPCVLSDIEEHHEVAGQMTACEFVNPSHCGRLSSAILRFLENPPDTSQLMRIRRPLLRPYSTDACARAYAEFFTSAIRRNALR
ncbi:MAG TPA: glycosyltransferase [Terracidiphilus sp.]|nr:glycosyltransferase [Terracidiphilus sp.]